MESIFIYHHKHPGIQTSLIENQIEAMNLPLGLNSVVLKNDHPEKCGCVEISVLDERVFWAYRGNRKYPSPMISYEDALSIGITETTDITIILDRQNNVYNIITCYVGSGSVKEPSTAEWYERDECIEFWRNHALIPDEELRRVTSIEEMPQWVIDVYRGY